MAYQIEQAKDVVISHLTNKIRNDLEAMEKSAGHRQKTRQIINVNHMTINN